MTLYRVGVDTGGTFSDLVVLNQNEGTYWIVKVPSTPHDPSEAVLNGLGELRERGVPFEAISMFFHGTTVATNALLQEEGAKTGLLITAGFRGVQEAMEQSRPFGPAIFDLGYQKPRLLAPERRTCEIVERIGHDGGVMRSLDEESIDRAIATLEREGVESVAISFLFSFMNPVHEKRAAEKVRRAHPEWWVTPSSELLPQIREYYRLSTTVVNAYVAPVLGQYIRTLVDELDERGVAEGRRFTMLSNGGSATFDSTAERAVSTILSGPAGGVTAGAELGKAVGLDDVITFDMGGTSCDVAVVQNGKPLLTDQNKLGERHIAVPMLDINTVSAGGGTVASVDAQGALRIGPESAGAVPGPACYGKGGKRATVTDADVVLGYLNPESLLGGALPIDAAAAEEALRGQVANPLGLDLLRAASGVVEVVNVKMAEAIRSISTERGFDLRDFTLIAFGGAGPLHACQVALEMGIPHVLVPPIAGATSALGLLMSDVKHHLVKSWLCDLEGLDVDQANAVFRSMADEARADLRSEGFSEDEMVLQHLMDMRYAGQGYENPVPVDAPPLSAAKLRECRSRFDEIHRECHGHAALDQPVEVVNYRLEAAGIVPQVKLATRETAKSGEEEARIGERDVLFPSGHELTSVPVYARELLGFGHRLQGPAIVEQYDATTAVAPQQEAAVDVYGNLVVTARELR